MSQRFKELLVKAYAKKYNVSEEDARSVLAPILSDEDRLGKLEKLVNELGVTAEALSKIPNEVKPIAASMLIGETMRDEGDMSSRELKKLARDVAMIRAIFSGVFSEDRNADQSLLEEIRSLKEENQKLREEIRSIREEKEKKELNMKIGKLGKMLKKIVGKLTELEERVSEVESKGGQVTQNEKKSIKDLKEEITSMINDAKDLLEALGYDVKKPSEMMHIPEKEYELRSKREQTMMELIGKHIGPALADYLKEPKKIAELLMALKSIGVGSQSSAPPQQPAGPPRATSAPPKLEEFLKEKAKEVVKSGKGKSEGGS